MKHKQKQKFDPPSAKGLPAKQVKAYTMADGKRIAAFTRPAKAVELNELSGKPRRWKYGGWNRSIDGLFEVAEVLAACSGKKGLKGLPLQVLKKVGERLRLQTEGIAAAIAWKCEALDAPALPMYSRN